MKKKFVNSEVISGYVYQHELVEKTVENPQSENFGKNYITGNLMIATDEEGLNVVKVHYTFIKEVTKNGSPNKTYSTLKEIMAGPTWVSNGKDAALKVKAEPALDLNDFYNRDGEFVSAKRNEGGFISILSALEPDINKRATFSVDMVITGIKRVEANEEKDIPEHAEIKGAVFNFKQNILPMTFNIKNPQGIDYFEGLEPSSSNPIFTKVWGKLISETIKTEVKSETAFGEALVKTIEKNNKEYLITGTDPEPSVFDDENTITAAELTKAMQDREVYLADVKRKNDEYQESKKGATTTANNAGGGKVATGGFNF